MKHLWKLTPSEFQKLALEWKSLAEEQRPHDVREETPESVRFYESWRNEDRDGDAFHTSVNISMGAYGAFLPQMLGRSPKGNCKPRQGTEQLAEIYNKLIEYRDDTFSMRDEYRDAFLDSFLRGTGFLRTEWDSENGIARSKAFSCQDVWIDHLAKRLPNANHIIERHRCMRWEFAEKFGKVALDVPSDDDKDVAVPEDLREDGKSPYDQITYYLLWSRHGGDHRVYAFHEKFGEKWINNSRKDGRPGEKWPFVWQCGEWHLVPVYWECSSSKPWGISFHSSVRGPIKCLQELQSFSLEACKANAKQVIFCDATLLDKIQMAAETTDHFSVIPIDSELLQGRPLDQIVKVSTQPDLAPALFTAINACKNIIAEISGMDAVVQANAQQVETAAEATRLSESNESRIADHQARVEEWITLAHEHEALLDARNMPKQSMLCFYPPDEEDDEDSYNDEDEDDEPTGAVPAAPKDALSVKVANGGGHLEDVPYAEAVLLEKGVPDPEMAEQMAAAAQVEQQLAQIGKPPEQPTQVPPEVQVRLKWEVPMDAEVKILAPGIEAFVGPELSSFWPEASTARELRREVSIDVKSGSTSRLGRVQLVSQIQASWQLLFPFYQQNGMYKQQATLINSLLRAIENDELDDCEILVEELQKAAEAAQQAAQQQAQQETENEIKVKTAAEQAKGQADVVQARASAEADVASGGQKVQQEGLKLQQKQIGLEGQKLGIIGNRESADQRQRDRSENLLVRVAGGGRGAAS